MSSKAPRQLSAYEQQRVDILARAGLKLAGFKPADLRKAHKSDVEALDAVRIRRSHDRDGNEVRAVEEPDWNVRLLASRAIKQSIPGMFPSQGAGMERADGQGLHVQIIMLQADGTQHVVDVTEHNTQGKVSA
jgi:hypothetical protein